MDFTTVTVVHALKAYVFPNLTYTPRKGALSTLPDYSYASITITFVIASSVSHITKRKSGWYMRHSANLRSLHCISRIAGFDVLFLYLFIAASLHTLIINLYVDRLIIKIGKINVTLSLGQPTAVLRPPLVKKSNPSFVAFFTVIAEKIAVIKAGIGPKVFSNPVNPSVNPCTKSSAPPT